MKGKPTHIDCGSAFFMLQNKCLCLQKLSTCRITYIMRHIIFENQHTSMLFLFLSYPSSLTLTIESLPLPKQSSLFITHSIILKDTQFSLREKNKKPNSILNRLLCSAQPHFILHECNTLYPDLAGLKSHIEGCPLFYSAFYHAWGKYFPYPPRIAGIWHLRETEEMVSATNIQTFGENCSTLVTATVCCIVPYSKSVYLVLHLYVPLSFLEL